MSIEAVRLRVPNQQRLISQSVTQAVESACGSPKLNLSQYANRRACIDVNGVFPHSETDLLAYVAALVEGEAARAGVLVVPRAFLPAIPRSSTGHRTPEDQQDNEKPIVPDCELRLVVSVDWSGVDYLDHKVVWPGRLAGQLLLGLGGATAGALSFGLGFGLQRDEVPSAITGSVAILGGLTGAIVWSRLSSPFTHHLEQKARTHITVQAIPVPPARTLAPARGAGEGESKNVIDTDREKGYSNELWLSEKK